MLEDLKLAPQYDGFVFVADAAKNPPILKAHHHAELELNLVERGTIAYVVAGRRFTFPPRTLLWMFPSQEHQLVDRSPDARYYVAVFKPELIAQACVGSRYAGLRREPDHPESVLHARLAPESFDLVRKTMDAMMEDGLDPEVLNREAGFGFASDFRFEHDDPDWLNAGLRHLLLLSWRNQRGAVGASRAVPLHPAVRKALSLLADELEPLNLRRLAKRCGVSTDYLSRVFARQVGVPLSRYRNSLRLRRFWDHYRHPSRPNMTEAAYAAGFGSYAQFYKVFATAYGVGPRACVHRNAPAEMAME